jgi:uncharacterized RDD family membrane protein YckC
VSNVPPPPPPPPPGAVPPPPPPPSYQPNPTYPPGAPPPAPGYPPGPGGYSPYRLDQPRPNYAGWWQRVGATIIDGLVAIPFMIPGLLMILFGPKTTRLQDGPEGYGLYEGPSDATIAIAILVYIAGAVVYLVLYNRKLGKTGATWGRRATGYKILDASTLQPIGTGRAWGRYFAGILNGCACYLGYLWPLWDQERRTFSDMIVKSRAIRS